MIRQRGYINFFIDVGSVCVIDFISDAEEPCEWDLNRDRKTKACVSCEEDKDCRNYSCSGLFLFMDTQSPAEVKGLIEGQDDLLGINEMPSMKDRRKYANN